VGVVNGRVRRGVAIVVVLLLLPVLFAGLALVIDVGYAQLVRAQLQAAADAATFSAARVLDGTEAGADRARDVARVVAEQNLADGDQVRLSAGDVDLGVWNGSEMLAVDDVDADAVRLSLRVDALMGPFGRLVYGRSLGATVTSVVLRGAPLGAGEVPFHLPVSVPQCQVESGVPGTNDRVFELDGGSGFDVSWAAPSGPADIDAILEDALPCIQAMADGDPEEEPCAVASARDDVVTFSGALPANQADLATLVSQGRPWDPARWGPLPAQPPDSALGPAYGTVLEGPIPVTEGCATDGVQDIVGFVWGVLYDLSEVPGVGVSDLRVRIDLGEHPVGTRWGGENYGVLADGPPRVVR
jgi:hypothetical protein